LALLALSLYTFHGLSNLIHDALPTAKRIFWERKCYYWEAGGIPRQQYNIHFQEMFDEGKLKEDVNWFECLLNKGKLENDITNALKLITREVH